MYRSHRICLCMPMPMCACATTVLQLLSEWLKEKKAKSEASGNKSEGITLYSRPGVP